MAELGQKRTCSECEAKFYDLGRSEVSCPECGHELEPEEDNSRLKRGGRRQASSRTAKEPEEAASKESGDAEEEDIDLGDEEPEEDLDEDGESDEEEDEEDEDEDG